MRSEQSAGQRFAVVIGVAVRQCMTWENQELLYKASV